jgi:DNA-directed RNA polymerase specialized sigma24 family protein
MAQAGPIHVQALQYARSSDFCKVFRDDMRQLYLLAYILTGDQKRAEQCFVAGLEDAVAGNLVFKNWARSWSRRTIIKSAIRMMTPTPRQSATALHDERLDVHLSIGVLMKLQPFERFVFVLTVLESYPDRESASLLNCRKQDVAEARLSALEQIGKHQPASTAPLIHSSAEFATAASFSDF